MKSTAAIIENRYFRAELIANYILRRFGGRIEAAAVYYRIPYATLAKLVLSR